MDIIRRKFDDNGDMLLNSFVSETEATAQAVVTRLREFLGEWFLDVTDGVDYFGKMFTKPLIISEAELELKRVILQTKGVKELISFELIIDNETRKMTANVELKDEWGNLITNDDLKGLNPIGIGV